MEVVFVLYNLNAGSTMVKGMQPAKHFGFKYVEHLDMDYDNVKNKILVFVGSLTDTFKFTREKMEKIQSNNNFLVLEPIDNFCYHHPWEGGSTIEYECLSVIDSVLTPNTRILENLNGIVKEDCKLINLPHNLDKHFFDIPQKKNDFFSIGYGGNTYPNEFFYDRPVPYLEILGTGHNDDVLRFCKKHTCHFSHRNSDTLDFMMKPASKVVVASVCRSPIVTSRDWSVMDLLPKDYPLLVSDDRLDVVKKIEYAKGIYGTKEWNDLLDIADKIKEKTSLDYQRKDYFEVFNHFGWREK
jgi:hypothetical protein